jgi:hypothetical protein
MYKVNISIDDISPHPQSSTKVLDRCFELINVFPEIKFSLFIPFQYWRTVGETASTSPYDIRDYPEFIDTIKSLPTRNFELCYHGLLHGVPGISNNDEFRYLNYDDALIKFKTMFGINDDLDLKFKPYFRPPAWRMSSDSIEAAIDAGIELLALSNKDYVVSYYGENIKLFKNIVNYNVNPPFDPLNLYPDTEIVYHACEWDKNYLDKNQTEGLIKLFSNQDIEFCFIDKIKL